MPLTLESPLVSADWLADHLADANIRILDCTQVMQPKEDGSYGFVSGIGEWRKGHIPNTLYVDLGGELSDPDHQFTLMMPAPEVFAETLRRKGIGDGTAVVCYDRGNHAWAARVWWMLRVCDEQCKRDVKNAALWDITVRPVCDVTVLSSVAVIVMNPSSP